MLATTLQGFTIGLAMIIPIGAQNAFVLSRGIHRNHHLLTATLCSLCDLTLIAIGVFGGANVLAASPLGMALLTWGGVLFLGWFGGRSLLSAWRGKGEGVADSTQQMGAKSVLAMTLGVTLLNPHVYLDTLMLLGSLGSQVSESLRPAFAAGAMLASLVWFYSLALGAAALAPWLARGRVQQGIELLVGIIMLSLAVQLAIGR
ncbi:L-lysine exporter [Aeromonas veronii]|uniref:L-lysine exporter n=1 Tax=Aeromonas veronii TaxID=654 RepID=UPI00187F3545|nr:L-lysine exporter [Aeromonas veronii]MBE8734772.1 amino acid transporter [Aeromonas veronii]MBE8741518.1 amino acid transporter [Aeromonas veronii]MBE8745221.1 amino acid transporter [Aeromonas veronii]MBE8764779.1 amino acid transporter [Aeromonas veronii]MBE8841023.1 amino acid transporter [Aeromonas veronii]